MTLITLITLLTLVTFVQVDAMGGKDSTGFRDFCRYCTLAYNLLRKHTSLIMNLLALMADAGFGVFAKISPATLLATVNILIHVFVCF